MFKPLLRTSPLYSGNIKIACELRDYNKITKDTFECNVRSAKLYPLSHQLFQKNIECNLLNSSYDIDIKNFYRNYSDYFFNNCFEYMREDMSMIDYAQSQYQRNVDFEYGVKRISYKKSGYQYAFFAPIYIDDSKEIPNSFTIQLELSFGGNQKTIKKLIVNIGDSGESKENYLYRYLKKYLDKIDSNVCFISQYDNSATYYGIDIVSGGLVKVQDNSLRHLFSEQSTINNFDASISMGFKKNKIAMRQILPLCFMFNLEDILTGSEKTKYKNCDIICSGYYRDAKYNQDVQFFDFSFDYDYFSQDIKEMDPDNGVLTIKSTGINIQDLSFPGLNEKRVGTYQFSNKLTPMFSRWKLKYSSDDYPYITNINYSFSKNQDSSYKYREFPTDFSTMYALCNTINNEEGISTFNFIFPLGEIGTSYYKKYLPGQEASIYTRDESIYNKLVEAFNTNISNSSTLVNDAISLYYSSDDNTTRRNKIEAFYNQVLNIKPEDLNGWVGDYVTDLENFVTIIINEKNPMSFVGAKNLLQEYIKVTIYDNDTKSWVILDEEDRYKFINEYGFYPEIRKYMTDEDFGINIIGTVPIFFNGEYADIVAEENIEEFKWKKNVLFNYIYKSVIKQVDNQISSDSSFVNTSIINKFKYVRNNYGTEWFDILEDFDTKENWWKDMTWANVEDDRCYYRGILYDFNNIYNKLPSTHDFDKIDKFAIFLWPKFNLLDDNTNEDIVYSDVAIYRKTTSYISEPNCNYSADMISEGIVDASTYMYYNEENKIKYNAELARNQQFKYIDAYTYGSNIVEKYDTYTGVYYSIYGDTSKIFETYPNLYLPLEDTNIQYNKVNRYYDAIDIDYLRSSGPLSEYSLWSYISQSSTVSATKPLSFTVACDFLFDNWNVINSYEMLPVHVGYMFADKEKFQEIKLNPGTDIQNQINFSYTLPEYPTEECYDYDLIENFYISTSDDLSPKMAYNFYGSYMWAGPINLCTTSYGTTFYRKGQFFKASNLTSIKDINSSDEVIERYVASNIDINNRDYFNNAGQLLRPNFGYAIDDLRDNIRRLQSYIGVILDAELPKYDEYEYHPILTDYNSKNYASSVFTRRLKETSEFYGDKMNENSLLFDTDCLWVDTYNLTELFGGKIVEGQQLIPEMPDYVKDMLNGMVSNNGLDYWRKDFYAKFLSKEHIYHYYVELAKDHNGTFPYEWKSMWDTGIYVRKRRLISNESIPDINMGSIDDRKGLSHKLYIKDEYITFNQFAASEGLEGYSKNFIRFYNDYLVYNQTKDLYSIKMPDGTKSSEFELCFKKTFIRLNEAVYNKLLDLNSKFDTNYRDLYIYRLEQPNDYEDRYSLTQTIQFMVFEGNDEGQYIGDLRETDECLVPLFNDVFDQRRRETQLYSNYLLKNITETKVFGYEWDHPDKYGLKDYIYRYNKPTNSIVIELLPHDIEGMFHTPSLTSGDYLKNVIEKDGKKYLVTDFELATGKNPLECLMSKYSVCDLKLYDDPSSLYDQLDYIKMSKNAPSDFINEEVKLLTLKDQQDGTKYGFYILELSYDNTINSFYLNTMKKIVNNLNGAVTYDYNSRISFFKYMNGFNIVDKDNKDYFENYPNKVIRELLPFMKISLLNLMNDMGCLVRPRMYSIQNIYRQNLIKNTFKGPNEIDLIIEPSKSRQSLLRYMNSIVPYIAPVSAIIKDQYNLKFKNVNARLIDEGIFNSIGDSVIYKSNMNINEYHPIQIYSTNNVYNQGTSDIMDAVNYNKWYHVKDYNMNIGNYIPAEYKHYNCSKVLNLSTELVYDYRFKMNYQTLLENEKEENVYKIFKSFFKEFKDNEDYLKYIYSKYEVEYDSVADGLNKDKTEKLYRLSLRYKLL